MPRLQHAVAIAMVLVAAIALGSSTYAWFVSNNNVTANTSSISAQSNAPFLVIKAGSAVTTDTITTDATTDPVANKVLFPVQMVKAEDNASAFQWESAYASASTAADEKASTRFIVQSADYNKYYMKETFYVGTNGTTKGQFKNLRVSGVTATPGSESEELKNALRVMVVCGEEVAIYDQKGTLVTTYVKQGESAGLPPTPESAQNMRNSRTAMMHRSNTTPITSRADRTGILLECSRMRASREHPSKSVTALTTW